MALTKPAFPANMNSALLYIGASEVTTSLPGALYSVPWRSLRINDEAIATDVTTTKFYDTTTGVQYTASATIALGLTLEVETMRLQANDTSPELDDALDYIQSLLLTVGQDRIVFVYLQFPADISTSDVDAVYFWANIENIVPLGGSVTDPAAFTFRLRSCGAMAGVGTTFSTS